MVRKLVMLGLLAMSLAAPGLHAQTYSGGHDPASIRMLSIRK